VTKFRLQPVFVLMAIRLVQPGRLADVLEGIQLVIPGAEGDPPNKTKLAQMLGELREQGLVCLYAGQRYELTDRGNSYLESAQIKEEVDTRRIFLLKASRRDNPPVRSDTRNGSL
jgi:hypothetical protein